MDSLGSLARQTGDFQASVRTCLKAGDGMGNCHPRMYCGIYVKVGGQCSGIGSVLTVWVLGIGYQN